MPHAPGFMVLHEARIAQHPKVLEDRRHRHGKGSGELADRLLFRKQQLQHAATGGITERVKNQIQFVACVFLHRSLITLLLSKA